MLDINNILAGAGVDDMEEKPGPAASDKIPLTDNNNDSRKAAAAAGPDPVPVDNAGAVSLLPPDFYNTIDTMICEWCLNNNIDDMSKAAALQWRACCLFIGQYIKQNNIIVDKARTAREGGRVYNPDIILELIDIWEYCCAKYKKIPLATDFIAFAGVSHNYFYGGSGGKVTTAAGVIWKKVTEIQAGGLASGIVDGRENPTGKIYFSKAVLGWSESGPGRVADDLPQEKQKNIPDFSTLGLPKL